MCLLAPAGGVAQEPAAPPATRTAPADQSAPRAEVAIHSTLTADLLAELPTADSLFDVLETTQSQIIGDRFDVGGLNVGQPARLGAFLGSWTGTAFRIGDADVTDPDGSGSPLFFPELFLFRQVDVGTGLMPLDVNAPAIAVSLAPRRPGSTWSGRAEGAFSAPALASDRSSDDAAAIARLNDYGRGAAMASGPVVADRLGLAAGASWMSNSQYERGGQQARDGRVGTAFANAIFTPAPTDELRTFALIQRARFPFGNGVSYRQPSTAERDVSVHVQSTWEHVAAGEAGWRAFATFSQRTRTPDRLSSPIVVERLEDGPVPFVTSDVETRDRRWAVGGRLKPSPGIFLGRGHAAEVGVDVERSGMRTPSPFAGTATELVDGAPSRVWTYVGPGEASDRRATSVAAYVTDRIELGARAALEAGLRYDGVTASAKGAANGLTWHSWLPRSVLRWTFADRGHVSALVGYRRTAYRLQLGLLAYGDPAAPTGSVYRPDVTTSPPLVARIGPGTGGNAQFTALAPDLARPLTDEIVLGVQSQPRPSFRMGLTGFARWEHQPIALVDTGVPVTGYALSGIADPGLDLQHDDDDQILPVYSRLASTFGQDRYLVTNPAQQAPRLLGLEASAEASTDRLFVLFGATASLAEASAASPGYHATENDQDVIGSLYVDPNAATFARGRQFADRAFTIKLTTIYRFAHDIRAGVIARYQDGQPFARMVVAPALGQGAEAIRAFPNGDSRFTFTGTLDLRLQKGFAIAGRHLDLIADAFNLINLGYEVEERVVTGAGFRTITAVQPPRAVHLGARVTF